MTIKAINTIMKEGFLSNRVVNLLCFSLCIQTGQRPSVTLPLLLMWFRSVLRNLITVAKKI